MTTLEPPALGGPIGDVQPVVSGVHDGRGAEDDPDVWIAQLMQCKPLSEGEVKRLCDKVSPRDERRVEERSDETSARRPET